MATGARGTGNGSEKGSKKQVNRVAPGTPPPAARTPEVCILPRVGETGPKFRALIKLGPADEIDITGALTAPLAHALWQLRGGPEIGNWVEAERLLDELLGSRVDPAFSLDVVIPGKRTRITP